MRPFSLRHLWRCCKWILFDLEAIWVHCSYQPNRVHVVAEVLQMRVRLLVHVFILWVEDLNKPIAVSTKLWLVTLSLWTDIHELKTFSDWSNLIFLYVVSEKNNNQSSSNFTQMNRIIIYTILSCWKIYIQKLSCNSNPLFRIWMRSVDHLLCSADFWCLMCKQERDSTDCMKPCWDYILYCFIYFPSDPRKQLRRKKATKC